MNDSFFEGLPVKNVASGSPAERAGILQGDIVVFANGERIENMQQYVAARSQRTDFLDVTILRGNRMIDFQVSLDSATVSAEEQR